MSTGKVVIITGGQWGSEAKGAVVDNYVRQHEVTAAVRTGCTNAGHTVHYNGVPVAMQQLPVTWANSPETALVIGAGAILDPAVLEREMKLIEHMTGNRPHVRVDYRAWTHDPTYAAQSKAEDRHRTLGTTGKGCSSAMRARIARDEMGTVRQARMAGVYPILQDACVEVCDTEKFLNDTINNGGDVLLEGCQGTLLDLYLSSDFPYTTHKQTTPAQWMSEAGLSPTLPVEIGMVLRTMPIRVAGNSGDFPGETSWVALARQINEARRVADLGPVVSETALVAFETTVLEAAKRHHLPEYLSPLDMHMWTSQQRYSYRNALSEIHKDALLSMNPVTVSHLTQLFEMTTVTKKLRRIANIDARMTETAFRQVRPSWTAITFMNYVIPEYWGETFYNSFLEEREWLQTNIVAPALRAGVNANVRMFNRGPLPIQMINVK